MVLHRLASHHHLPITLLLTTASTLLTYHVTTSFTAPLSHHKNNNRIATKSSSLKMAPLPPLGHHEIYLLNDILSQSSTLIADAADAVAEPVKQGWWGTYLNYFKSGLELVHGVIDQPLRNAGWDQTWGPSIALFTLGVRGSLTPISIQQSKSSEYMKALKPYQDEIKEKFKDKQEMQNRAIAKLYEDAGQNPLAGCLFSLLQLPIFLGLYRSVTLLAKDGQLNEPFLWIPSLEGPVSPPNYRGMEWLTQGWHDFTPSLGWETTLAFLAMPCILVLLQSSTMRALQPDMENMSEEEREQYDKTSGVLKFLPLLIGYFSLQVPAGLTIYWVSSNLFTLSQSLAVRAYYKANPPTINLPDYWDALDDVANMSPEERRKAAEAGINTGPKFEDMLDEARFHYLVPRDPIRENSAAWQRVQNVNGDAPVPPELEGWVSGKIVESTTAHATAGADATSSEKTFFMDEKEPAATSKV
mmetsp:Transcript_12065/g.15068  ORF Transcript_12065/g.15068 Transcript_12065/m.15068 type:complete len:471 (+) Transcript_12065:67-1479(+)